MKQYNKDFYNKLTSTELALFLLSYGMQEAEVREWIGGKQTDVELVWNEIQRIRNIE